MNDKYIKYTKGYKYQLEEEHNAEVPVYPPETIKTDFITLTPTGQLTTVKGYAWDGPSGPTFDTLNFMRASARHDPLYQLIRLGLLDRKWRKAADKDLYDTCREDGMSRIRAWYVVRCVRRFAASAAHPNNKRKVYTAP